MKFFVIAANFTKTELALPCQEQTSSIVSTISPQKRNLLWKVRAMKNEKTGEKVIEYISTENDTSLEELFTKPLPSETDLENEEVGYFPVLDKMHAENMPPVMTIDNVNHPSHYTQGSIECIDAIEASMTPAEFRGAMKANIIKYLWRYEHKNGLEDLKKARFYLERMIAAYEKDIGKEQA